MLVKELIEKLVQFDNELPVIVKSENTTMDFSNEKPIKNVVWEFDGACKIIVENR